MHWTTSKLLALNQAERFLDQDWVAPSQFAELVKKMRHEIPPHLVTTYDQLKREHKEPMIGVCQEKCIGCNARLSPTALVRLSEEHEASNCEQCGRFIYLASVYP